MADKPQRGLPAERAGVYQAPALDKGIDILEYLSTAARPTRSQTSPRRSTAPRTRSTAWPWCWSAAVTWSGRRTTVSPSPIRLFQLGIRNPPLRNLLDAAMPLMHELAEGLEQSCHLAVTSGDDMVVVARVESPGLLGFAVRVGYRRHIVEATSGRVLFGFQPEERQARWLPSLRRSAPKGADVPAFLAACEATRREGFAMADSSFVLGVTDIATPVYDGAEAGPLASLTMPFLARRDRPGDAAVATAALTQTGLRISERLRHG
jgi:DNA-binding IclR family transcriptional regulator